MEPKVLEVVVRKDLNDSFADSVKHRVKTDLGIELDDVRTKEVYIFDTKLTDEQLEKARKEIFEDPQVQISSFDGIEMSYDYMIEVAWKPGVTDTKGRVAGEAVEDLLKRKLEDAGKTLEGLLERPIGKDEKIYTSRRILLHGKNLTEEQVMQIAKLYANQTVQDKRIFAKEDKFDIFVPKVDLDLNLKVEYIDLNVSDEKLFEISNKRKLSLNLEEMKAIQEYFKQKDVIAERLAIGMQAMPTDVEIEQLAQTWSEHCKHKIFNAEIKDIRGNVFEGIPDVDFAAQEIIDAGGVVVAKNGNISGITVDSIFKTYIRRPTLALKEKLPWIVSVLEDNAGVVEFDDKYYYALKIESHNSPSAEEPYGGAYTGIVGVFRDPMGTGRGGKIIGGVWFFHTGSLDYKGKLRPKLSPRQIHEGVRQGVEAGGNRSGNPTFYGYSYFDEGFIGKPYIGVGALSIIPREVNGEPGWKKIVKPGYVGIVVGGRVGIDGIHGATESSLEGGKHISAGHVQIGDAYMQKKVQELVIEARDLGYIEAIQDFGAGGLSSAFGELAEFTNGLTLDISKHPVKYAGLRKWQMWVSESQERMAFVAKKERVEDLMKLAKKHGVEMNVLGEFNDSGKLFVKHGEESCSYLNMKFLHSGGPRFKLEAEWKTPEERGLIEPVLPEVKDHNEMLKTLLSSENIASQNYIVRQFDHEVQGGSVVKPLVGVRENIHSDASVLRPVLDSNKGIAMASGDNPQYGQIDTYHMTMCNFDEAIRKVIAIGGDLKQIPMNDNFGWPSPKPGKNNPDAGYKTAQLWRAAKAVADGMRAYGAPCVSGKDSMSMDGTIQTADGKEERVSAPAIAIMSAAAKIEDTRKCITMDVKQAGDLVYILGMTKDELGGSEYYKQLGELGRNVPVVDTKAAVKLYEAHSKAANEMLIESSHGIYRGGLATHLALKAVAGELGMYVDLRKVPNRMLDKNEKLLYSESAGRLIVTVAPENMEKFEKMMEGNAYAMVGVVTEDKRFKVQGLNGEMIINEDINNLRSAYHKTFDNDLNEIIDGEINATA
jgi:phosphoribosylformylglycinamidine synthase